MCKIAVTPRIVKPEEALKLKGKKIREILKLDYGTVSKVVREAWTPERRERIKTVAREVGAGIAEAWETDPTLSSIAGALSREMFNRVKMGSGSRLILKATRFKYHDPTNNHIWIIALPATASLDFAHRLKTGTVTYAVGGYVAEYERTAKGLQLVKVYYRGYDAKEIAETVKRVKPELIEKARNKLGVHLKKALSEMGISV